ncbi:hypothetical protein, partial [Komagataeibacter xylinus]|uniref:hypothetical protein n=1 Tax=Komagataeibacter xylinus TaxID=28448 RepID=UPI001030AA6D
HDDHAQFSNWGIFNQHIWGDYNQHSHHRRLPPDMDRSATRCSPPPPRPREGQRQGGTPPTNVHEDVDVSKIQIGGSD